MPPDAETLNFRALLQAGIAKAQELSHVHWTDFNEHDPGVTILENLCYALTDLGYRTSHPIEDILSSSAAVTGVKLEEQPLFTGDKVLSSAPLTENDYRKLIYDSVRDVRNVWLKKVEGDVKGLFDVYVQPFAPMSARDGDSHLAPPPAIIREVENLLYARRNMGEDFNSVKMIQSREFAIDTVIEIASNVDPEGAVANMLFNVEMRLNPVPELRDVDSELQKKVPVELIFEGPNLPHGTISNNSLHPLCSDIPIAGVLEAMRNTPAILRVSQMEIVLLGEDPGGEPSAPVLSRQADRLRGIKLYCDGVLLQLDTDRVLSHLRHFEEKQRWQASYAMRRMMDIAYARVPQGNARRQLSHYRSIQHLFPSVYGIGKYGAGDDLYHRQEEQDTQTRRNARAAEVRQLKGFLLFFEQLLTDYLAQLENTTQLFSFKPQEKTYYSQPIVHLDVQDDDAPHDISPILGAPASAPGSDRDAAANQCWHQEYTSGLKRLAQSHDPVQDRQNRALDHFLARFNEGFENKRLKRLRDDKTCNPDDFLDWVAGLKRRFMADFVDLSANRGLGLNIIDPAETRLEQRIKLKSGFDGELFVIEHVLLRSLAGPTGIGALEVARDFRVGASDTATAVRISSAGSITAHLVLEQVPHHLGWRELARQIARLGARRENYTVYPPGAYQVSVRLADNGGIAAEVLENFSSHSRAEAAIKRMVALCQALDCGDIDTNSALSPVALPLAFFSQSASVFLAMANGGTQGPRSEQNRAFVEGTVAENMPAHISQHCFWLQHKELSEFRCHYETWIDAISVLRGTACPGRQCRADTQRKSHELREWIHRLYCRTFLENRAHRRSAMNPASG